MNNPVLSSWIQKLGPLLSIVAIAATVSNQALAAEKTQISTQLFTNLVICK